MKLSKNRLPGLARLSVGRRAVNRIVPLATISLLTVILLPLPQGNGAPEGNIVTAGTLELPQYASAQANGNLPNDPGYVLTVVDSKGRGATWNTCKPIRYLINPNNAPVGAEEFVVTTMNEIEQQTGIDLEYGGLTSVNPWSKKPKNNTLNQKQTVTILWDNRRITGEPMIGPLGYALVSTFEFKGRISLETGAIVFSTEFFNTNTTITSVDKEVLLHEFGHVLNLSHTSHQDQVMYPVTYLNDPNKFTSYQDKDLIGISKVKRKKC